MVSDSIGGYGCKTEILGKPWFTSDHITTRTVKLFRFYFLVFFCVSCDVFFFHVPHMSLSRRLSIRSNVL